jgi:lipid-A-disaccharide synthase
MLDRYPNAAEANRTTDAGKPSVVLLPGSRKAELRRHLPVMMGAWQAIQAAFPEAKATMVLPNDDLAAVANASGFSSAPNVNIQVGGLADALSQTTIAISKTGTVTMECALFGVPTVTLYKASWFTYRGGKLIATVSSLTMANLLAGEPVFPEFIQGAASAANIGRASLELFRDESRRNRIKARLREIVASLGGPGASRRAAEAILKRLSN